MSAPNLTHDFIITGFGCAGMSLVYYLLNSHQFKNCKILVIDNSKKTFNDRTWCYWAEKPLAIHPKKAPLVFWEKIEICLGEKRVEKQLGKLKYFHIKSSDFYSEIKEQVISFPNVHFVCDSVISINEKDEDIVTVLTSKNGIYFGKKVFNSIPDRSTAQDENKILKQVFVGWKIKTTKPRFKADTAVLMNFLQESKEKTDFFYLLPFSATEALIEYTVFTTQHLDFQDMEIPIQQFISQKIGQESFEITFKEEGSIPMTTLFLQKAKSPNIIYLGTLAGCSKPSTGYTFQFIQKHCKSIVQKLEISNSSKDLIWKRKRRFTFYDNIILNVAKKWPNDLPKIFFNLFESNTGPEIFKFLNEETGFLNELKLLSRLKFSIFIKSLLHYEKH